MIDEKSLTPDMYTKKLKPLALALLFNGCKNSGNNISCEICIVCKDRSYVLCSKCHGWGKMYDATRAYLDSAHKECPSCYGYGIEPIPYLEVSYEKYI
jgi:DnaJ-class molecular chaperone